MSYDRQEFYAGGPPPTDLVVDPTTSSPVFLRFGNAEPQSRATVFFRLILVLPQLFVLYFVSIAAYVVVVIGWFAALFTGRLPESMAEFLAGFLRWNSRVLAYEYLMTDKYPPFSLEPSTEYPVDFSVRTGKLNRWSVLFRYFLAIPGLLAVEFLLFGMSLFSIINWVATLVKGEQPPMYFEAYGAAIRYYMRLLGYFFMLTSFYPSEVLGDEARPAESAGAPPLAWAPPPSPGFGAPLGPTPVGPPTFVPPEAPLPPASGSLATGPAPTPTPAAPDPPGAFMAPVPSSAPWDPTPGVTAVATQVGGWRLVLSAGARKLVVTFFVLGAIGLVADGVFIGVAVSHSNNMNQALTAQNQAVGAYNETVSAVQRDSTAAKNCGPSSAGGEVHCLEENDAKLGESMQNFSDSLSSIDFPSSVSSQAAAAEAAASQAATAMKQIANAGGDASAYRAAVLRSNIQRVFNNVDATFQKLNSALIDQ